ncbi:hypothetical protein [Microbacterium sp. KR10-403]|uniref:hypothetical protein n=1 Tax=Microbacterium sp. KR10-403 TaxID=3158581 RepID=UPI0032E488FF
MARLQADASPTLWVPVTGSLGFKGRRHRKAAIRMLLQQASGSTGVQAGGKAFAWLISQAAPLMMRKADGRVLVWMWKDDPGLVVAMAQLQEATPQIRTARAMMPMEYDDTVSFRNPHLGEGEKLVMKMPSDQTKPPFATYTWDMGTHFVTLTAVGADRERFGTVDGSLDDLARTLRVVDDLTVGEADVLRLDPS